MRMRATGTVFLAIVLLSQLQGTHSSYIARRAVDAKRSIGASARTFVGRTRAFSKGGVQTDIAQCPGSDDNSAVMMLRGGFDIGAITSGIPLHQSKILLQVHRKLQTPTLHIFSGNPNLLSQLGGVDDIQHLVLGATAAQHELYAE